MPDTSASGNGFGSRPQDRNRKGRLTSDVAPVRALILKTLAQKRGGKTQAQALVDGLVKRALAGNMHAAKLVLYYGWGRPALQLQHTGDGLQPVNISVADLIAGKLEPISIVLGTSLEAEQGRAG